MQVDALTMQVDALTMQVDALTLQVDALTLQVDALTLQVDALTLQVDALTLQEVAFRWHCSTNIGLTHTLRILICETKALAEASRKEGDMPPVHYANDKLSFLTIFA
ncbi:hypothetical protein GS682_16115 [Nostoc sp. B(2019)]|nr:hypothetical protein [Nostoc sp. B(2019)]